MGRGWVAQTGLGEEDFLRLPLRSAIFTGDEIHDGDEFTGQADAAYQARLGVRGGFDTMAVLDFFNLVRGKFHG